MILIKKDDGFTLVEILVAITILSFMMVSIYTIVDNNITTKEEVVSEDREFLQMYTAMHRLKLDISQIYSPFYFSSSETKKENQRDNSFGGYGDVQDNPGLANKFVPSPYFPKVTAKAQPVPIVEQRDKNTLMFMTGSNRRFLEGQKQSRLAWVEYTLIADDRENPPAPNMLVRRHVAEGIFLRDFNIAEVKPQVLLRGVKELIWEFWSRQDLKWVDNIQLLPPTERETLRAVRLTLTWIDTNNIERTTLRVFRPLWPYFDRIQDQKEREAASRPPTSNQNRPGNNNIGAPGGNPRGGN